jgi:hypothetical protein
MTLSPEKVVMGTVTRVVTGGVLPVTTRCMGLKPTRQAAFFRVMVSSDRAKRPASQASLAMSSPASGE